MIHSDTGLRWRSTVPADFTAVSKLASNIHVDFPESDIVMQEKFQQFPTGCCTLAVGSDILGYLLSHPWKRCQPPPLNKLLGRLPPEPDAYYIHDLALAVSARGRGMAELIVDDTISLARFLKLDCVSLVAIGGSQGFWGKQKF